MISIQSKVHVDGIKGTELLDFLLNCTDEQYQAWWPGTHLAFHTVERRPDHVGSSISMDEYVGRRRLRMKGIVSEVVPGKRVVWQFKQIVRLPARLIMDMDREDYHPRFLSVEPSLFRQDPPVFSRQLIEGTA